MELKKKRLLQQLILGLMCFLELCCSKGRQCPSGFNNTKNGCVDVDECDNKHICGENATCLNTNGSFYCECKSGFTHVKNASNFTPFDGVCYDYNECLYESHNCSINSTCQNLIGSFACICHVGYTNDNKNPGGCLDIDECNVSRNAQDLCGEKGQCVNVDGSYKCNCDTGYTTYGNDKMKCSKLNCGVFGDDSGFSQSFGGLGNIWSMMRNSCLALSDPSASSKEKVDGDTLLKKFFTATEAVLSPGRLDKSKDVSRFLGTVENSILLISPQLKNNRTKMDTSNTEADIAVQRGKNRPTGPIHLTNQNATVDTDWTTASGSGPYPGFAFAALLSYKNLSIPTHESFQELEDPEKVAIGFKVASRVVSVVVSNPSPQNLSSVKITLQHVEGIKKSPDVNVSYICAYWKVKEGIWSKDGCYQQLSNDSYTVCTCNHLSSFAVLMALYPMEHTFGLQLVTKIGLIISLLCLTLCILTFIFCRSIQGTRTTIHLHLCICLFVADLVFLAGISKTKPEGGCRFVAALLHYSFLGVFSWMLLEGVQLYRMVVLVFNATMRPLYLFAAGYGMPLAIVIISAIIRPHGYGTEENCWLSLKDGLIWSFYGPVCLIIVINVFFFIVTVWKLAQKFTSLNPELSKLHKIRAFTVTAIAQMCILGLMWVFGAFLFSKDIPIGVAYIFTILNSLQGALVFIMHCLLSKQVREEYAHFFSCVITPQRKRYSDFSSTNPSSSQTQGTGSGNHTGESHI